MKEALRIKVGSIRRELAGPKPTPVGRLLVGRVVSSWLQVYYADALAAQAVGVPIEQLKYIQSVQEQAQRRHLEAIEALTRTR